MPIRVQNDLPVKEILESENIFVMDQNWTFEPDAVKRRDRTADITFTV